MPRFFLYFSAVSIDSSCRSSVNSLPCSNKLKHAFHVGCTLRTMSERAKSTEHNCLWHLTSPNLKSKAAKLIVRGCLCSLEQYPEKQPLVGLPFLASCLFPCLIWRVECCYSSKNLFPKLSYLKISFFHVREINQVHSEICCGYWRGEEELCMWQGLFVFHQLCSWAFYLHSW